MKGRPRRECTNKNISGIYPTDLERITIWRTTRTLLAEDRATRSATPCCKLEGRHDFEILIGISRRLRRPRAIALRLFLRDHVGLSSPTDAWQSRPCGQRHQRRSIETSSSTEAWVRLSGASLAEQRRRKKSTQSKFSNDSNVSPSISSSSTNLASSMRRMYPIRSQHADYRSGAYLPSSVHVLES